MNIQRAIHCKRKQLIRYLLIICTALTSMPIESPANEASWRVGAAKTDITPNAREIASGDIWLGGYGSCLDSTRTAAGVHDPISARAMVLSDGNTTLAMVMVDTIGISNRRIRAIRDHVHDATGIPEKHVLVGTTHTHSGPDMQGLWCGVSDSYKRFFEQQTARAVIDAANDLKPAAMYAALTAHTGRQRNRRGWHFTDEDLAVIQAVDQNQRPIATLVEFASHATCMKGDNRLISRDWPGAAQDRIEQRGGGIGIVNTGDQGDVLPEGCGNDFNAVAAYGESLADAAYDSLPHAMTIDPPLVYQTSKKNIPVANGIFIIARILGWLDDDLVYPCSEGGGFFGAPCINTDIGYLRAGPDGDCQLQAAVIPGELLTRGGVAIKASFTAPNRFIFGLTSSTLGYAVPSDEWMRAPNGENYEETVSPTETFGDTVIDGIAHMVDQDSCR